MIRVVDSTKAVPELDATLSDVRFYLDTYALLELAKDKAGRKERVIRACDLGADILFSTVNAAEIVGPELDSTLDSVTEFLDAIGPHWFPAEGLGGLANVLVREGQGCSIRDCCIADHFAESFFNAPYRSVLQGTRLPPSRR